MQKDQHKEFLEWFTKRNYTEVEHQAFAEWLKTAPIEEVETLAEEYGIIAENQPPSAQPNQELMAMVEAALDQSDLPVEEEQEMEQTTPIVRMWKKIAVAVVLLGLVGSGIWFITRDNSIEELPVAETRPLDIEAPKLTKAVITLADGRIVALDSMSSGMLALQNEVKVVKNERGEIVYQSSNAQAQGNILYNSLYNPRGSNVVNLTLADGTKVLLNSGSSLNYPVAFVGKERKVTITGEAYFEVSQSVNSSGEKQTFQVESNGITTTVLGTHFNVNAYQDEPQTKITLLEGSVRVSNSTGAIMLQPGEQARIQGMEKPQTIKKIDTDQVIAWKNGTFNFGESTNIKEIMRQVGRWYNVEIEYKNNIEVEFGGSVPRQVNISKLLEKFEMTGRVKFQIEGQKVIVSAP